MCIIAFISLYCDSEKEHLSCCLPIFSTQNDMMQLKMLILKYQNFCLTVGGHIQDHMQSVPSLTDPGSTNKPLESSEEFILQKQNNLHL